MENTSNHSSDVLMACYVPGTHLSSYKYMLLHSALTTTSQCQSSSPVIDTTAQESSVTCPSSHQWWEAELSCKFSLTPGPTCLTATLDCKDQPKGRAHRVICSNQTFAPRGWRCQSGEDGCLAVKHPAFAAGGTWGLPQKRGVSTQPLTLLLWKQSMDSLIQFIPKLLLEVPDFIATQNSPRSPRNQGTNRFSLIWGEKKKK